ncbi:MAG: S9 family peptidase [Gammaproteobacteria bacterium]
MSQPRVVNDCVYWLEGRPAELGRSVLVCARQGAAPRDLTPTPFNVRSRVHEYGGGAYTAGENIIYFVNHDDQQIYRQSTDGGTPKALSSAPGCRFADLTLDKKHARLVCVCEDHSQFDEPPRNTLVSVAFGDGRTRTLAQGSDFYSSPTLSPDGLQLAWLCWNAPLMPWQGCELWLAELDERGVLQAPRRIAGGAQESIFQPQFAPDGVLHFVSDSNGYWNIYRHVSGSNPAVTQVRMDHGFAQWNFGMSSYGFLADGTLLATRMHDGVSELLAVRTSGASESVNTGMSQIEHLHAAGNLCTLLAASPTQPAAVLFGTPQHLTPVTPPTMSVPAGNISAAQFIRFPADNSETVYAWYYPPCNPEYEPKPGERPPLLVTCHGGPTAMSSNGLDPRIQFWTSRGFAIADVNYRGSSGFGRAYRESLRGEWGIKDAEDCIATARYLVEHGLADARRLAISGGSAGGFTVLCALAFHDYFKAGAVYYGLSELATAMRDTHKFEAHYGDSLLGPWPEARDVYHKRSPLYAAARIRSPVIFFQGLKDKIVPPGQTERMVAALRSNGVPVQTFSFPEEGHGFRRRDTLEQTLGAELAFYGRTFRFVPAADG